MLARLQAQAAARPRFGYRRLQILLAREGLAVNHKPTYRIYRAVHLQVRRRKRKRLTRGDQVSLPTPNHRLEQWSMDFMVDTLVDGRVCLALNIVDDFTRECMAIEVDRSLPGARVVRVPDRLHAAVGLPQRIVLDNGPEFVGRALDAWAYARGARALFHSTGKIDRVRGHRKLQREGSRRMPERALVCQLGRRKGAD